MISPEARFARDFTAQDRAWLDSMAAEIKPPFMVSGEQYMAAVDSNDFVTRQNFLLRQQRRRWARIARRLRISRNRWRGVAFALACWVVALSILLWSAVR